MQIKVHHVGTEVPRTHLPHQRVHVGAVHVHKGALGVQQIGDLVDLLLEHTERVGIGKHQRGDILVYLRFERRNVDHPGCV